MINHYVDIDQQVVKDCIADYYSNKTFRSKEMAKADPRVHIDYFTDLIIDTLGEKVSFVSGNYYKHSLPYLPHTDYKKHLDNKLNIVIPLEITGEASLLIFDQMWLEDSVTWDMGFSHMVELKTNTYTKGSPIEYDITNKTGEPFDKDLHNKYIKYFKIEDLYGLSAIAYDFIPGKAMIFDNRRLHCTSHFKGEKLGLSLRFKYG